MQSRVLFIVLGLGLLVAAAGVRFSTRTAKPSEPGRLHPKSALITWGSEGGTVRPERPRFELTNVGGTAVNILGVRSGCGCTVAHASPKWVPPRGRAYVDLEVTPPEVGARAASIVIETDSPTFPEVLLQVIIEGRRRPPYVLGIKGDLYFRAGHRPDEVREIVVETIQVLGAPAQVPSISSDLPFLHIDPPVITERPHGLDVKLIGRDYMYAVRFSADPPSETFDGQVSVNDPWEAGRTAQLAVHGEASPPIQVAPSRLVLVVGGLQTGRASSRFLARAWNRRRPLRAEMEKGDASPLCVTPIQRSKDDGFTTFEIRWKEGRPFQEGVQNVIVQFDSPGGARQVVPVLVKR